MKQRLSESKLIEIISEAVINETSGSYNLPNNSNRCVLQETINRMGSNYLTESIDKRNYYCDVAAVALTEGYITRYQFLSMLNEAAGRLFSQSNSKLLREGKEYEIVYDSLLLEEVGQRILSEGYQFGDFTKAIGRGIGHAYNAGKDAVNWAGDKARQAYQGAKNFVNTAVDNVSKWAKQGWQAVSRFASNVVDSASKAVVATWQKLGAVCKSIGNGIVKVIDNAGKMIGYIIKGVAYAAFATVGLGIMTVQAAYQGVVKGLQSIGCLARKVAEGTWEIITSAGKIVGKVANGAIQLGKDGMNAVASLPSKFLNGFMSTQQGQQMVQSGLIKGAQAAGAAAAAAGKKETPAQGKQAPTAKATPAQGKQAPTAKPRYIKQLQQTLAQNGYEVGAADGILGPKTMAAARAAGVNPNTWKPGDRVNPKTQALNAPTAQAAPVSAQQTIQGIKMA